MVYTPLHLKYDYLPLHVSNNLWFHQPSPISLCQPDSTFHVSVVSNMPLHIFQIPSWIISLYTAHNCSPPWISICPPLCPVPTFLWDRISVTCPYSWIVNFYNGNYYINGFFDVFVPWLVAAINSATVTYRFSIFCIVLCSMKVACHAHVLPCLQIVCIFRVWPLQ